MLWGRLCVLGSDCNEDAVVAAVVVWRPLGPGWTPSLITILLSATRRFCLAHTLSANTVLLVCVTGWLTLTLTLSSSSSSSSDNTGEGQRCVCARVCACARGRDCGANRLLADTKACTRLVEGRVNDECGMGLLLLCGCVCTVGLLLLTPAGKIGNDECDRSSMGESGWSRVPPSPPMGLV